MKNIYLILLIFMTTFSQASIETNPALPEEVQTLWDKRADKASLIQCLGKFEALHKKAPKDRDMLTYLARAYFLLGELSMEPKEKMSAYTKAKHYGMAGLNLNPEFKKMGEEDLEKAAKKLTVKEMPSAFWTAAALGRWSDLNGVMSSLKWKNPMLALVAQVEKLQPDYFYGAVYRFWGGFYSLAPSIVGGDLDKSKGYFEKVQKLYPEYIGTKVAYAEMYMVAKKDEKNFKRLLQEVVATPIAGPKDIEPENKLEQYKASILLKRKNEFF